MLTVILKLLAILANWLLAALVVGVTLFSILFIQDYNTEQFAVIVLTMVAFYAVLLLPALLWLVIGLLFVTPLFFLLFWIGRRSYQKRAERKAYQQRQRLYEAFPVPVTPPRENFIPLMQRQFKH